MASSTTIYASAINSLIRHKTPSSFPNHHKTPSLFRPLHPYPRFHTLSISASKKSNSSSSSSSNSSSSVPSKNVQEEYEEIEEEEDLPWIQEKALDLVEFTGSVTQALPGPRVGSSSFPWLLTVPLAYVGVTFVIAFVRTVQKFNSPKAQKRRLVDKNADLLKSIDELFEKGRDSVNYSALKELMNKTGFKMEEILRKYIRYALNENVFDLNLVANLIHLRKASMLDDEQVADIINDISKRIVKDKGPVVMDMSGYSEKGFRRKLVVQSLFGKIYYLSQLPEFCSRDSTLKVKETFGVTDEDAEKLRLHTMSEVGDVESLEKLIGESEPPQDAPSKDSL